MGQKKLVVAGTGIKSISHLTIETQAYIKGADLVLSAINEPILFEWLKKNTKKVESFSDIYFAEEQRHKSYQKIAEKILEYLNQYEFICVVTYGHPTVFAQPFIAAANMARKKKYDVLILPGISAEDCLFADFSIDPGTYGCYSVEATSLLLRKNKFDTRSHLIIWQVGMIGDLSTHYAEKKDKSKGLYLLQEYLQNYYPPHHIVYLYEASMYPGLSPKMNEFPLNELTKKMVSPVSTLFVPPVKDNYLDEEMAKRMNLKANLKKKK